ncbi:MAG: type II toxin-antitoxin system RelE/ParE family toxin [Ginsengibacter sp.]
MVEEIVWSPIAIKIFDNILDYLFANFGEKSAKDFVQRVDAKLKLIQSRPRMFRRSGQRPNTYITVIKRKTTLTYRYKKAGNKMELIVFWGMQNPSSKP